MLAPLTMEWCGELGTRIAQGNNIGDYCCTGEIAAMTPLCDMHFISVSQLRKLMIFSLVTLCLSLLSVPQLIYNIEGMGQMISMFLSLL